tara:strand:- start:121420 stop:122580 length:1161 start_codon:yes stop_codon:yes gene_type:complete
MAEQQDSGQERTEQPTPKRLADSRKKGQVARSRELNTMLSLVIGVIGLLVLGNAIVSGFSTLITDSLDFTRQEAFDKHALIQHFSHLTLGSLLVFSPFLAVMIFSALVGPLTVGGWSFSPAAMAFKLEKLNPISGLKRLFSAKGLLELLKALFKFVLIIAATVLLFNYDLSIIMGLSYLEPQQAAIEAASLLIWGFLILSCVLIFIVVFDVPFELWNHKRQLKMTRQEVRDEMKETDGRPEVKSRIKQLQREISQGRMMEAVPTADVVITNPTHFAVALKYDESPGAAPKVVAKGRDMTALRIRALAEEHNIVLFEAPPLARALYGATEIGEEISHNLYMAVARVLAYVFALRTSGADARQPDAEDLQVPLEYRDFPGNGGVVNHG